MTTTAPKNAAKSKSPKYILTTAELGKLFNCSAGKIANSLNKKMLIPLAGGKNGIPFNAVREFLQNHQTDYKFKTLAHINLRGGIGKTTSSICVATRAVQYGFKTCILDLDPQGSASFAFGIVPTDDDALFCDVWPAPAEQLVGALKQIDDYLYLLPSSLDNSVLDSDLQQPDAQKNAVRDVCEVLKKQGFDLVVIDCPPSLGAAVVSSVCAADIVVVPVAGDAFSFRGLELSLAEITAICETFQCQPPDVRALLVKYNKKEKIYHKALQQLGTTYEKYALPVYIRTSSEIVKMLDECETLFAATKMDPAREDYDSYTRIILDIMGKRDQD